MESREAFINKLEYRESPMFQIKNREVFIKMLEYLAGEVDKTENIRIAAIKKRQLQVMENYFFSCENYIQKLHEEQIKWFFLKEELETWIKEMEAICIIHGVNDFTYWRAKGWGYLFNQVMLNDHEKTVKIPNMLLPYKNRLLNNGTII